MRPFQGLFEHPTPEPYPFGPPDVASILDAGLAEHPDRVALIDDDRSWTWTELDADVSRVAAGITPGELIWFALGNCAEQVIGTLATFRAGGIGVFLPERRAIAALPYVIERLGATTLIGSREDYTRLTSGRLTRARVEPGWPAAVAFTSGTSGEAKAVVHSQRNLLWPGLISAELEPSGKGERIGTPLQLSIMNIAILGPISSLLRGSTFVVMDQTFAIELANDIERFAINRLFTVPTLLHDLVDQAVDPEQLRSLDRVIVGGSGAEPQLLAAFTSRFGVRPTVSYGLTEAPTGIVRESLTEPIGSRRGFPLPHVSVSVIDENGLVVPTGSDGEICLSAATSGPWANTWTPTLGYLGEPDRTDALFEGGVLHTGDRGRLDKDGALSVTGRLSNLIIRGGMNIDPTAVEDVLVADTNIDEAVVVGVPDDRLGERIGAIVVPARDATPDLARLRDAVRKAVSSHAVPDVIIISDGLSRGPMGKLARNLPPDLFAQGDIDLTDPRPVTTELRNDRGTLEG
jgi:long-chain acyl-CoA synthetase